MHCNALAQMQARNVAVWKHQQATPWLGKGQEAALRPRRLHEEGSNSLYSCSSSLCRFEASQFPPSVYPLASRNSCNTSSGSVGIEASSNADFYSRLQAADILPTSRHM